MICKKCKIIMIPGTTYGQEQNRNGGYKFVHKRFDKCPKCGDRQYISSSNSQEMLRKVTYN